LNPTQSVSWLKRTLQEKLFPQLQACCDDPITEKQKQLVAILEVIEIERYVQGSEFQWMGRKIKDRKAIARAFVAKAVFGYPTTRALIEALASTRNLRDICGFPCANVTVVKEGTTSGGKVLMLKRRVGSFPSEATFSRAFATFAAGDLGESVHKALVKEHVGEELLGHVSHDSTAILGHEKPARTHKDPVQNQEKPKPKKRGRPKKGEIRTKELTRLEKQKSQTAEEGLRDIPTQCNVGSKRDSKGYKVTWNGFKLHGSTCDTGLPISAIVTSASVHDSQVAIPMVKRCSERTTYLYDLMDAAYDAASIREVSREMNHVPLIDRNARGGVAMPFSPAEKVRYNERTGVERFNSRMKEEFGADHVMVRGYRKVKLHLMFGVVALFADQLLKLCRT